jgi:DNA-directed RNA polymerase specialized sigma24 family protein
LIPKAFRTSLRISVAEATEEVVGKKLDAILANPTKTGRLRFPTTRWTVVRRVASETGDESLEAIEWLYRAYWSPLFSTVLRMGFAFHEAEDLTQGFLTKLVSNGTWSAADPTKGTLRSYLCTGLRRFVFDELGKRQRRPLDYRNDVPEGALDHEVTVAFDRAWGLELFQRAQRTLMNDLSRSPDFAVSTVLVQKVMAGGEGTPNAEIAAAHGLTEDAVKMRTLRLRKQWQRVLRDEVAKTVSSPAEIDAELRHLIMVLSQR